MAIIETKNRAMAIVRKLEEQLDIPKKVRIHWTGCPNSCAQARPAPGSACLAASLYHAPPGFVWGASNDVCYASS